MRTTLSIAAGVVCLLLSACSSEPPSSAELCPSPTDATSIELGDFFYGPECAGLAADSSVELRNTGEAPHTFTVNDTEIDVNVDAGGTDTVDLAGIAPGTYEVVCTLHPQMEGALRIT